jgi:hypothetical protein
MRSACECEAARPVLRQFIQERSPVNLGHTVPIDDLWMLLDANRLCSILGPDDRLTERQEALKKAVWSNNAPALATIYHVAPLFAQASLASLFIKGPLLLHRLYGNYFFRAATDVDLVVPLQSASAAVSLLKSNGFELDPNSSSLYWRFFLGEQHYLPEREEYTIVDLHSRLRHPYMSGPNLASRILSEVSFQNVGDADVPVPTVVNQTMLSIVYLLKGILRCEPVGCFLVDLAVQLSDLKEPELEELIMLLERARMVTATARLLTALRVISPIPEKLERKLGGSQEANIELFRQLLAPEQLSTWRRIQLVAKSSDTAGSLLRALHWQICRKLAQQAAHAKFF